MLRALVWDVDGTLAETEHDGHRVAFNQAFAEHGLPWHWDEVLYHDLLATTGGKERMWAWWRRIDPAAAAAPDAVARIASLHARKTAIYGGLVARGAVQLRPGVAQLLQAARADGLVLAIATTTVPDNVLALLQATLGPDTPGWFACIGAGDVVPHKKPAPDIYLWVLQRLGLPASDCLALEDSAPGSTAAVAAGLPTVVTRSRYTLHDTLPVSPLLRADLPDLSAVDLARLRAWHAA
ncbi:MAG: HAD-IA family hydrolase [Aquabacterium sp.]|nr:HAD-IA family hydrolase [Aquabacterium sp.]